MHVQLQFLIFIWTSSKFLSSYFTEQLQKSFNMSQFSAVLDDKQLQQGLSGCIIWTATAYIIIKNCMEERKYDKRLQCSITMDDILPILYHIRSWGFNITSLSWPRTWYSNYICKVSPCKLSSDTYVKLTQVYKLRTFIQNSDRFAKFRQIYKVQTGIQSSNILTLTLSIEQFKKLFFRW